MSTPQSHRSDNRRTRRTFLAQAAGAAAFSIVPRHVIGGQGQTPPSEKITLAAIGCGGQGMQDLVGLLAFPEIQAVAVCDVERESGGYISWNWTQGKDQRTAGRDPAKRLVEQHYAEAKRSGTFKGCTAYDDYRQLLDKEDVDAVLIATPDHTHAVITMAALHKGKHVYCEKPLTYSVGEARAVAEAARAAKVATQLGNQGQATEEARVLHEFILDGALGPVHEVNVWSPARFWTHWTGDGRPKETPPIPAGMNWDAWLGPAPERPYHPAYHPWTWRNWWDFGTGLLGDLGCHKLSSIFKALKLGHPTAAEACGTRNNGEVYPIGVIARYEFPARGEMPPLTLNWYDGGLKSPRPKDLEPGRNVDGVTIVGEKATLMGHRLIPETKMKAYGRPPRVLPRSPGHLEEWVGAIRGGPPPGSNFVDHAGILTEAVLLGNVALRAGKRIEWDGPGLRVTNDQASNKFLNREYRQGWTL